ncbi:MAG: hypothetical protein ACLTXT_02685 [Ruminococcus callidus]
MASGVRCGVGRNGIPDLPGFFGAAALCGGIAGCAAVRLSGKALGSAFGVSG